MIPIFCKSCGSENDDDATFCVACGVEVASVYTSGTQGGGESSESHPRHNQIANEFTDPNNPVGNSLGNAQASIYELPVSYDQPLRQSDHSSYQLPRYGVPPPQFVVAPKSRAVFVIAPKSRAVFVILGLFFGWLGVHNFYAGYTGRGVAQLLITVIGGWLGVGIGITLIWALVEIIAVNTDAQGVRMT